MVIAFDLGGESGSVGAGSIETETRLRFAAEMPRTVCGGQHFNVLVSSTRPLVEVINDTSVGNLNAFVHERKIKLPGDLLLDFGHVALRIGLALGIDGFLNLGL